MINSAMMRSIQPSNNDDPTTRTPLTSSINTVMFADHNRREHSPKRRTDRHHEEEDFGCTLACQGLKNRSAPCRQEERSSIHADRKNEAPSMPTGRTKLHPCRQEERRRRSDSTTWIVAYRLHADENDEPYARKATYNPMKSDTD